MALSALSVVNSADRAGYAQSCPELRQQHAGQYLVGYTGQALHRPKHAMERRSVSCEPLHRTLRDRLAVALRRRVGIGKAITPKQLAYALRLSPGTIDNLLNGNNDPSGRALMALLTFFDASFANEILEPTGCTVAKLSDARRGFAEDRAGHGRAAEARVSRAEFMRMVGRS